MEVCVGGNERGGDGGVPGRVEVRVAGNERGSNGGVPGRVEVCVAGNERGGNSGVPGRVEVRGGDTLGREQRGESDVELTSGERESGADGDKLPIYNTTVGADPFSDLAKVTDGKGLQFVHLNVQSLLPKIDEVRPLVVFLRSG